MAKNYSTVSQKEYEGFINRFDNQNEIINAKKTIVDYDVNINISSEFGQGGAAIIWSDETTDFMGSIIANGYLSADKDLITMVSSNETKGGFIEISSKDLLRTVLLDRVDVIMELCFLTQKILPLTLVVHLEVPWIMD